MIAQHKDNSTQIESISRQLQQVLSECNQNPLVPRAFQPPVDREKFIAVVEAIARLVREPLEEKIEAQQAQITRLQEAMERLQTGH